MSEEKDSAQAEREMAEAGELEGLPPLKPQLQASPGMPERKAVGRRQERVREMMHTLSPAAQEAIRANMAAHPAPAGAGAGRHGFRDEPTTEFPRVQ